MIRIENLSFHHRATPILHGIDLSIEKGGLVALIGPNGAGKSTLLSLMARLQTLQSGSITIDGHPVDTTPGPALAKIVAILRQDTLMASRLRVRELVAFGRFPHGRGRMTDVDHAIVEGAIGRLGLQDLADRFLETLSGGQRQRAFVAMTLAQDTDYLLLDEPLNNLDMYHARELMRSLRAIASDQGRTVVVVLHDVNQASAYADRVIALKDGRIVADGSPQDVLTPDSLERTFGFAMPVQFFNGRPFALPQF